MTTQQIKYAYTVRVELIDVEHESAEYTKLHENMNKEGFRRTLTFGRLENARTFKLPPAEYNKPISVQDDIESVLKAAKRAATATVKSDTRFRVLVTKTSEARARWNLEEE